MGVEGIRSDVEATSRRRMEAPEERSRRGALLANKLIDILRSLLPLRTCGARAADVENLDKIYGRSCQSPHLRHQTYSIIGIRDYPARPRRPGAESPGPDDKEEGSDVSQP